MPASSVVFFVKRNCISSQKVRRTEQMLGMFLLVFEHAHNLFVCHWEALCFPCGAPRQCDRYENYGRIFLYSGSWIHESWSQCSESTFYIVESWHSHLSPCPVLTAPNYNLSQRSLPSFEARDTMKSHTESTQVRIAQKQIWFRRWRSCIFFPIKGREFKLWELSWIIYYKLYFMNMHYRFWTSLKQILINKQGMYHTNWQSHLNWMYVLMEWKE